MKQVTGYIRNCILPFETVCEKQYVNNSISEFTVSAKQYTKIPWKPTISREILKCASNEQFTISRGHGTGVFDFRHNPCLFDSMKTLIHSRTKLVTVFIGESLKWTNSVKNADPFRNRTETQLCVMLSAVTLIGNVGGTYPFV